MYLEYCNYNKYIDDYPEEIQKIFRCCELELDGLALPVHLIKETREYLPSHFVISTAIDHPCGLSSSKVKYHNVINSIKSGANAIDFVLNHYFLKQKFSELLKEVETVIAICEDHGATMRVFLDYRHSPSNFLIVCNLLYSKGVNIVFPTVGYHHDDFFDNIINSKMIQDSSPCGVIFNGYTWQREQIDFLMECGLFGARIYNLELLV